MEINDKSIARFFEGLRYYLGVSREARAKLAAAVAPAFNVFDHIRPDENTLSKILVDLLDPGGSHGQGERFLVAFLEELARCDCYLPRDWRSAVEDAIVTNEAATSFLSNAARRIDIRIELRCGKGAFGIGIENKPWAVEQPAQLSDYQEELERRYPGRTLLIFLCPHGRAPESMSRARWSSLRADRRCAVVHYSTELARWLRECKRRSDADKVRHFLEDFTRYIDGNLAGTTQEEQHDGVQQ